MIDLAANAGQIARRRLKILRKLLIECVALLQQKSERSLRRVGAQALLQQRRRMKADRFGGAQHAVGRSLANRMALIENAVDRRHADARGAARSEIVGRLLIALSPAASQSSCASA